MISNETQSRAGVGVSTGTRLNGIYEIEHQIGAGGMGEVYKGKAIQTGDPVAVKMMLGELVEDEAALALFRKEASALHYLQHDAIVRYYVFTIEPVLQRPYLAMEFVDGRSLNQILQDGPLTFEAVCALMQRIASGLQAAHDRGIIHRDVSPDNIIIPQGDVRRAKIIDFGIARSAHLSQATVIGSGFAGTPILNDFPADLLTFRQSIQAEAVHSRDYARRRGTCGYGPRPCVCRPADWAFCRPRIRTGTGPACPCPGCCRSRP